MFYRNEQPETFFMVMELGCESLTTIKKNYRLTEAQWVFVLSQLTAALKYIHR